MDGCSLGAEVRCRAGEAPSESGSGDTTPADWAGGADTLPLHSFLLSPIYPSVERDLQSLGFSTVRTEPFSELAAPVCCHGDLLCFPLGKQKLLLAPGSERMEAQLREMGFDLVRPLLPLGRRYPRDTALCAARVGEWILCRRESTDPQILSDTAPKRILSVRQGYTRCSTLAVGENALITADPSIARAAENAGILVLQIRPGFIRLDGYATGFIGGCGGMIHPSALYVSGKLTHPDGAAIRAFSRQQGIQLVEGSQPELIDFGSLIPLR